MSVCQWSVIRWIIAIPWLSKGINTGFRLFVWKQTFILAFIILFILLLLSWPKNSFLCIILWSRLFPPFILCVLRFLSLSMPSFDDMEIIYSLCKYRGHCCLINRAKKRKVFLFTYTLTAGDQEKSVSTELCLENVLGENGVVFQKNKTE